MVRCWSDNVVLIVVVSLQSGSFTWRTYRITASTTTKTTAVFPDFHSTMHRAMRVHGKIISINNEVKSFTIIVTLFVCLIPTTIDPRRTTDAHRGPFRCLIPPDLLLDPGQGRFLPPLFSFWLIPGKRKPTRRSWANIVRKSTAQPNASSSASLSLSSRWVCACGKFMLWNMCVQCCNVRIHCWTRCQRCQQQQKQRYDRKSGHYRSAATTYRVVCPQFLRSENCTPVAQLGEPSFGLHFCCCCKHLASNLIAQSAAVCPSHFIKVFNYGA